MSRLEAGPQPGEIERFCGAVERGEWPEAERLLAAMGSSLPDRALRSAATLHMRVGRWREAGRVLDRLIDRQAIDTLQRTLARNMAELEAHRPEVYRVVMEDRSEGRYQLGAGAWGRAIVLQVQADGRAVSLSGQADPVAAVRAVLGRLGQALEQALPISLYGVGDGYLLAALAGQGKPTALGAVQPVYLVEPDPLLLRVVMMLHDYTGPDGPIQQGRFCWFIGPQWAGQWQQAFEADDYLAWPAMTVRQSVQGGEIAARVAELADRQNKQLAGMMEGNYRYYRQVDPGQWSAMFGPHPPRRPRVLVLTTRFSTVLQHASRDVAGAFEQLGWSSRLEIEPAADRRHTRRSLVRAVAQFQPDLVFQLDHLRSEHGDLFPPQLPFACWIQDHLPNLLDASAGRSVGLRDYVLTAVKPMYVQRYGYPARQCIDLPKLTAPVRRPARWTSDGPDLVFVSNASGWPDRLIEELAGLADSAAVAGLVERIGRALLETYRQGRCVPTRYDFQRLVEQVERQAGRQLDGAGRDLLLRQMFNRLNNALYRQQALRWAVEIARRRGLTVGLYGQGWQDHPDFAAYAQGPVAYGADLEQLTRRARINLQIVPYGCFHQRLFDGLVAGGFFLIRRHPYDTAAEQLGQFLSRHVDRSAGTVEQVRRALDGAGRARFEQLLARHACLGYDCDPVALLRGWESAGLLEPGRPLMPDFDQVAFDSGEQLDRLVERYLADADLRREVAGRQCRWVEQRWTYTAGMKRVIGRIAELLQSEKPS